MDSSEYDKYKKYLREIFDEELEYETDDVFYQISDIDGDIKYLLCVEEHGIRERNKGETHVSCRNK